MPFDDSNIKRMIKDQMEQRLVFTKKKELTLLYKDIVLAILQPQADKRFVDHGLSYPPLPPRAEMKRKSQHVPFLPHCIHTHAPPLLVLFNYTNSTFVKLSFETSSEDYTIY